MHVCSLWAFQSLIKQGIIISFLFVSVCGRKCIREMNGEKKKNKILKFSWILNKIKIQEE